MPKRVDCDFPPGFDPRPEFISKMAAEILDEHDLTDYIVSISMIGDGQMADLNQRFKGVIGSTDVLSFVLEESPLEAEIYLTPEQTSISAESENLSLRTEILKLIIHGVLHLLGYHHDTEEEKAVNDRVMNEYLERYSDN